MKIGIFGIGSGICADPGVATRVAQAAERAGLESLWTGEHVVLPDPQKSPSPAPPLFPMLHPSTVLAYVAAVTTRVKLGTGIALIAQRNPVVLAKEMASLDVVSGGRLILGVGAGYLEPEFRALGVPFGERGARTDEYIAAMRVLWRDDKPAFDGRFVRFGGIQSRPRPVQAGGPPIVVGGASDAAIDRAVASAQGWYGFAMDVATAAQCVARLGAARARVRRDSSLGELEISITPRGRVTADLVRQFADAGVHRLIALVPQDSEGNVLDAVAELGALAG
jgi:probable F420-dependent oxidoreductase